MLSQEVARRSQVRRVLGRVLEPDGLHRRSQRLEIFLGVTRGGLGGEGENRGLTTKTLEGSRIFRSLSLSLSLSRKKYLFEKDLWV